MEMNSDLIRGNIDTIILGFLVNGDKYGYEIYKLVLGKSGGEYEQKNRRCIVLSDVLRSKVS